MSSATEVDHGRMATRPKELTKDAWLDIGSRVRRGVGRDNLSMMAAGAAFYGLFAIFPAIAALVSLYGLFTDAATVTEHMRALEGVLPEEARGVLDQQLRRVSGSADQALGFGVIAGLLIAIWSSTRGIKALMTALNVVYNEEEKRGFIALNATALLLTATVLVVVAVSLAAIALVPVIVAQLPLPPIAETLARLLRWPLLALVSLLSLAMVYRYGPSRTRAQWRWVTWGAAVATLLWLIVSGLFSWYVSSFGSYNETYGSVAAIAVLMMWLWLSAFVMLIGGEINAEMEHQTRRDTTIGRPEPLGERGAYVADHVGDPRR